MHNFRSIAALQPNPRRLTRQKYYQKNAARMIAQNSVRYRNQAVAQREIPDGLASPAPSLPPVPKAQRKAEKERETKAKADAKSRAKKVLPKPRFYIPYQKGKVGNESQRHKRSGSESKNLGERNNVGGDNPCWVRNVQLDYFGFQTFFPKIF